MKHLVAQGADSIDLQLDSVPMFEKTSEAQAAAVARTTRAEELPRMDGLVLRDVGEDFLERKLASLPCHFRAFRC
jgi:hypothetical protein